MVVCVFSDGINWDAECPQVPGTPDPPQTVRGLLVAVCGHRDYGEKTTERDDWLFCSMSH